MPAHARRYPDAAVISFYQASDDEFFAVLVCLVDGRVHAETVSLASGSVGKIFARNLRTLGASQFWQKSGLTEGLLYPLLEAMGDNLIPRLECLGGNRRVILIPHRWTHILPMHIMLQRQGETVAILEDVASAVTYTPSLSCFEWSGLWGGRPVVERTKPVRKLLACVDVLGLGQGADLEVKWYNNLFSEVQGVDIIVDPGSIPEDKAFPYIVWSSHGFSDPTNWKGNRLVFGGHIFSADSIMAGWNLRGTEIAILSACETGIDFALDNFVDEYSGLDMAFHVAGASTVVSTMWRVEERVAAFTTAQLIEGLCLGRRLSEFLPVIRRLLALGGWYDVAQRNYREFKRDKEASARRTRQRLQILEALLSFPKNAFEDPAFWGVYRCFGRF